MLSARSWQCNHNRWKDCHSFHHENSVEASTGWSSLFACYINVSMHVNTAGSFRVAEQCRSVNTVFYCTQKGYRLVQEGEEQVIVRD